MSPPSTTSATISLSLMKVGQTGRHQLVPSHGSYMHLFGIVLRVSGDKEAPLSVTQSLSVHSITGTHDPLCMAVGS